MYTPTGSRRYLHPGEGAIDFGQFFTALKQRWYTGSISLEASAVAADGVVDITRIQHSVALLRDYNQA